MKLFEWLKRKKKSNNSQHSIKAFAFYVLVPSGEFKDYEDLLIKSYNLEKNTLSTIEKARLLATHEKAAEQNPSALLALQKALIADHIGKKYLNTKDPEKLLEVRDEIDKSLMHFVNIQVKGEVRIEKEREENLKKILSNLSK